MAEMDQDMLAVELEEGKGLLLQPMPQVRTTSLLRGKHVVGLLTLVFCALGFLMARRPGSTLAQLGETISFNSPESKIKVQRVLIAGQIDELDERAMRARKDLISENARLEMAENEQGSLKRRMDLLQVQLSQVEKRADALESAGLEQGEGKSVEEVRQELEEDEMDSGEKLSALERAVRETQVNLVERRTELAEVNRKSGKVKRDLERANAVGGALETSMARLEEAVSKLADSLLEIEGEGEGTSKREAWMDEAISVVEAQLHDSNIRLKAAEKLIVVLEAGCVTIQSETEAWEKNTSAIIAEMAELGEMDEEEGRRLGMELVKKKLARLRGVRNEAEEAANSAKADLESVSSKADKVETANAEAHKQLHAVEDSIDAAELKLSSLLEARALEMKQDRESKMDEAQQQTQEALDKTRMEELEGMLKELDPKVEEVSEQLEAKTMELMDLKEQLERQNEMVNELRDPVQELEGQLAEVGSEVGISEVEEDSAAERIASQQSIRVRKQADVTVTEGRVEKSEERVLKLEERTDMLERELARAKNKYESSKIRYHQSVHQSPL